MAEIFKEYCCNCAFIAKHKCDGKEYVQCEKYGENDKDSHKRNWKEKWMACNSFVTRAFPIDGEPCIDDAEIEARHKALKEVEKKSRRKRR